MQIQQATQNDLPEILALQKQCYFSEAKLHDEYNIPPLTQDLESITSELKRGILMLKVVSHQEIIGSVRGHERDGTGFIGRLIVKENHQNKKIGQHLMNAIEEEFQYCTRFELFTGFKSEKNIYLYGKLGYKEFKRQVINKKLTLVYLEKFKS